MASAWVLDPRPLPIPRVPLACLLSIAAIGLLQTIPLPVGLVSVVSPARLEWSRRAAELAADAGQPVEVVLLPLSLAVFSTLQTALYFAAMAGLFAVSFVAGRRREQRRILLGSALVAGLFQVLYGGGRFLGGSDRIWGTPVASAPGRFRGTFVNPDHFAFFLGLLLPLVFAWGWWGFRRARRLREPAAYLSLIGPPVMIWVMLFVGQALSGSRAGLLAALLTVVSQGVLVASRKRQWKLLPLGIAMGAIGVMFLSLISLQQGLGRLLQTSSYEIRWNARFEVYRATLGLIRDFFLTGSGLGTFREVFPTVQPESLGGSWWHAHNDFLEILLTGGVLAAIMVGVGLVAVSRGLLSVWRDGDRSEDRAAGLAVLGTVMAAALHSCFDFGITMPASAFMATLLIGAASAAEKNRSRQRL